MPTIENIGAYKIQLHTREVGPPHVHVTYQGQDVVVYLLTLEPYGKQPFRVPRKVMEYLERHQLRLIELWEQYHG